QGRCAVSPQAFALLPEIDLHQPQRHRYSLLLFDTGRPTLESLVARILFLSPSTSRPSLRSSGDSSRRVLQLHLSVAQWRKSPPEDPLCQQHLIRMQSLAVFEVLPAQRLRSAAPTLRPSSLYAAIVCHRGQRRAPELSSEPHLLQAVAPSMTNLPSECEIAASVNEDH